MGLTTSITPEASVGAEETVSPDFSSSFTSTRCHSPLSSRLYRCRHERLRRFPHSCTSKKINRYIDRYLENKKKSLNVNTSTKKTPSHPLPRAPSPKDEAGSIHPGPRARIRVEWNRLSSYPVAATAEHLMKMTGEEDKRERERESRTAVKQQSCPSRANNGKKPK